MNKMKLGKAYAIANKLARALEKGCEKIQVAGSVRREKAEVSDIEIVDQPHLNTDANLLGDSWVISDSLTPVLEELGNLGALGEYVRGGDRQKVYKLPEGIPLELYIVLPPAQWGVILTLRTGPQLFSKKLVTQRRYGGFMPAWARCKDGGIYDSEGNLIEMPEEQDFFKFLNLPWLDPRDRDDFWALR